MWLFAAVTTYTAIQSLIGGLQNLDSAIIEFENLLPFLDWNRDLAIVTTSAWFTIEMIPVLLVVAFASRFARWFVSVMAFVPITLVLSNLEYASTYPRFLVPSLLIAAIPLALAGLLWSRHANPYFAQDEEARATLA